MATGIEHRSVDSVMQAYDYFEKPNFAIYQGKDQRTYYDGGNQDEGAEKLREWLTMIEANGTGAVYTLKVYKEAEKDITAKAAPSGSTTFLLSATTPVTRREDGTIIIDRTQQPQNTGGGNAAILSRIESLEKTNRELQDKLHQEQLKAMEQNFKHQIAGLQVQEKEQTPIERIGEALLNKPDNVDKLINIFGRLADGIMNGLFAKNNYIQPPAPVANNSIQGTEKANTMHIEEDEEETGQDELEEDEPGDEIPVDAEGALINTFLTEDEKKLKKSAQGKLMIERLSALDQDNLDTVHMCCIEVLEARISAVTLARMLITVASLDNEDLNKLLNHLD